MILMLLTFFFLLTLLLLSVIANISTYLIIFPHRNGVSTSFRLAIAVVSIFIMAFLIFKFDLYSHSLVYYYVYGAITGLSLGIIVGNKRSINYLITLKANLFAQFVLLIWIIAGVISVFLLSLLVTLIFKISIPLI